MVNKNKKLIIDRYKDTVGVNIKDISQIEIDHCIKSLKRVDKKCKELFEDKIVFICSKSSVV